MQAWSEELLNKSLSCRVKTRPVNSVYIDLWGVFFGVPISARGIYRNEEEYTLHLFIARVVEHE